MPVTQIPSRDPLPPPADSPEQRDLFEAQHWETAYRGFNPDDVPHLLIQLQDDLSRARKREALWLSVILHLLVIMVLWNSDRLLAWLPHRTVDLAIKTNPDQSKDATFLELPPDEQKVARRPDAKIISDKDRIATTKAPQINREELRKLLRSPNPGEPGGNRPQLQPTAPSPPQQSQVARNQPPAQQDTQQGLAQPQTTVPAPRLQTPPQSQPQPSFQTPPTAGQAIQEAAEAAVANRGHSGGGQLGDGGLIRGRDGTKADGQMDILTDTMGVDFWPYMQRIRQVILTNWMTLMPPSFYPPILKQGIVSLDFYILPNGKVSSMVLHTSSGDVSLDRAAWGSITASDPFPPLPKEFHGQVFGLRCKYYYNLEPGSELK